MERAGRTHATAYDIANKRNAEQQAHTNVPPHSSWRHLMDKTDELIKLKKYKGLTFFNVSHIHTRRSPHTVFRRKPEDTTLDTSAGQFNRCLPCS